MATSAYPFDNCILNELVEALLEVRVKAAAESAETLISTGLGVVLRTSPLLRAAIPKRRRSRTLTLQGIRADLNAKAASSSSIDLTALNPFSCSLNYIGGGGGKMVGSEVKVGPTAADNDKKRSKAMTAAKKGDLEIPKYVIIEIAPLKLVIRRVKPSETQNVDSDREHKRKMDDTEFAEENISNVKKIKLMSWTQQKPMITALPQPIATATRALASFSAQELPSTKCKEKKYSCGFEIAQSDGFPSLFSFRMFLCGI